LALAVDFFDAAAVFLDAAERFAALVLGRFRFVAMFSPEE
jgi:hypothetical protein